MNKNELIADKILTENDDFRLNVRVYPSFTGRFRSIRFTETANDQSRTFILTPTELRDAFLFAVEKGLMDDLTK